MPSPEWVIMGKQHMGYAKISRDCSERKHCSQSRETQRSRSSDRKSHKHQSCSSHRERRSTDEDRNDADEKSIKKAISDEKPSEVPKAEPMEVEAPSAKRNGTSKDIHPEGDCPIKTDLIGPQIRSRGCHKEEDLKIACPEPAILLLKTR
ncbi:hypothetical protein SKAU_G00126430 [Synaphobranchus kaupii]|uniref:Uncharacterized protein n=1 Tax=Synaphobranchus kaupii TaxID=118154 RepID=A0A9Q1J0S5_SYNKA|nr:hypothetical protein SKAU_G00126430 [Synaphobranchus kaupii]